MTAVLLLAGWLSAQTGDPRAAETITIDMNAKATAFPHFWEQTFGSGRAILSLRDSYRRDLRRLTHATGVRHIRFHGIFDDETGFYDVDAAGRASYNFSYIDQIYDGLLEAGVRPYIELSFMPSKLASSQAPHPFWYRPLPNPPKNYGRWGDMIAAFVRHLVERYGIDEVSEWPFEVWNEPNIDFWSGSPKLDTYYELYDAAAKAVKSVNARLMVGGPATAQAAWVDRLIEHCAARNIPLDFVSTHVYGNDTSQDVLGVPGNIPRKDMVARAVRKVHDQVIRSRMPKLPIHWSEYNASYMNEPEVTDAPYMGPWLANNIRLCDGLTTSMSYWTFSDVFEEQGVVKKPFYGGYGLIAAGGIPKPAFHAFAMLHRLGTERLPVNSDNALVTRASDGRIMIAVWNYAEPADPAAGPRNFSIKAGRGGRARVWMVDGKHGNVMAAWKAMGAPSSPTQTEISQLRRASDSIEPSTVIARGGSFNLALEPYALAILEIQP